MKALLMILTTAFLTACVSSVPITTDDGRLITPSRTLPERMTDIGIERAVLANIYKIDALKQGNHRIAVDSHQGLVLLTGEVPSEAVKQQIQKMTVYLHEVEHLYNYLVVTDTPKSQSHTVHESYLKGKIRAKLLTQSVISPMQYGVEVRDDFAYVMGSMSLEQKQAIEEAIASVDGLKGVRFLIRVLTPSDPSVMPSQSNTTSSIQNSPQNTYPPVNNSQTTNQNGYFDNGVNSNVNNDINNNTNNNFANYSHNQSASNSNYNNQPAYNQNQASYNTGYNLPNLQANNQLRTPPIAPKVKNTQSGYVQLYQDTPSP